MTPREYMLLCFAEEAIEVAHAASKVMRFTEHDAHTIGGQTNIQKLQSEFSELMAMVELLEEHGIVLKPSRGTITRKKERYSEYEDYSTKLGVIEDACHN